MWLLFIAHSEAWEAMTTGRKCFDFAFCNLLVRQNWSDIPELVPYPDLKLWGVNRCVGDPFRGGAVRYMGVVCGTVALGCVLMNGSGGSRTAPTNLKTPLQRKLLLLYADICYCNFC